MTESLIELYNSNNKNNNTHNNDNNYSDISKTNEKFEILR